MLEPVPHEDVLFNIEVRVVAYFEKHPELTDYAVDMIYEDLFNHYRAQKDNRTPRPTRLTDLQKDLHQQIKDACDLFINTETIEIKKGLFGRKGETYLEQKTVGDIMQCLKRLRKSIKLWTKEGGRQGYLQYISEFIE